MDRGGWVAACVPDACTCERESSGLVPSSCPSPFLSIQATSTAPTPPLYIYDRTPPTSHLRSDTMCRLMHITAYVSSSFINEHSGVFCIFHPPCPPHSSNGEGATDMVSNGCPANRAGLRIHFLWGTIYVFLFALLCVGTGGLAQTVAPREHRPALHSETGCYVTSICPSTSSNPLKFTSRTRHQPSGSVGLFTCHTNMQAR